MKLGLSEYNKDIIIITGTITDFSIISNEDPTETILLSDLKNDKGEVIASHSWIRQNKNTKKLILDRGDIVKFSAKISTYIKRNGASDYKLTYVSKVEKISTDYTLNRVKNQNDIIWQARRIKAIARRKYFECLKNGGEYFTEDNLKSELARADDLLADYKRTKSLTHTDPSLQYYKRGE